MPGSLRVTRRALRTLLDSLLPAAADFDALCIDHFPQVDRRFASGMDRTSRTNLLLAQARPDEILAALGQLCGGAELSERLTELQSVRGYLRECETEELSTQLEALLLERDRLRSEAAAAGHDIDLTRHNLQIAAVKKELRRGPRLHEGEILDERFILQQRIGHGGYGDVWLAFDRRRQCLVALKVLHGRREDPSSVDRFYRGARVLLELSHPHLVRVLEPPGEHEGFHYFVMEYLHGGDLERALRERRIERAQALQALLQAASALAYAHQQGLIHRDIKPTNILLDGAGGARLTDFDLVCADDSTGGTASGVAMGTLLYSAPEVHEDARRADALSDVYSLGMTLVCVLHGRPLPRSAIFHGLSFARSVGCPAVFLPLIESATSELPSLRPSSAHAFCQALEAALAAEQQPIPLEVSPAPPPARSAEVTLELSPSRSDSLALAWVQAIGTRLRPGAGWLLGGVALGVAMLSLGWLVGQGGRLRSSVGGGDGIVGDSPRTAAAAEAPAASQHPASPGPGTVAAAPHIPSSADEKARTSERSRRSKRGSASPAAAEVPAPSAPPLHNPFNAASQQSRELTDMFLTQAQTEYLGGRYLKAIQLARSAERGAPQRAWRIIGGAACHLGDLGLVQQAFDRLHGPDREYLITVCKKGRIVQGSGGFQHG